MPPGFVVGCAVCWKSVNANSMQNTLALWREPLTPHVSPTVQVSAPRPVSLRLARPAASVPPPASPPLGKPAHLAARQQQGSLHSASQAALAQLRQGSRLLASRADLALPLPASQRLARLPALARQAALDLRQARRPLGRPAALGRRRSRAAALAPLASKAAAAAAALARLGELWAGCCLVSHTCVLWSGVLDHRGLQSEPSMWPLPLVSVQAAGGRRFRRLWRQRRRPGGAQAGRRRDVAATQVTSSAPCALCKLTVQASSSNTC